MNLYITSTRHVITGLLALLWQEGVAIHKRLRAAAFLNESTRTLFAAMQRKPVCSDDIEIIGGLESTASRCRSAANTIAPNLQSLITARAAIAGAVLQIAKQGISTVHTTLAACPNGRQLGLESLTNIIWQGRNQSMHYEAGGYHKGVVTCFKRLEVTFGSKFRLGSTNLAFEVVKLLNWRTYDSYETEMAAIL